MLTKLSELKIFLVLIFLAISNILSAQNVRPNILLIIADDLGVDASNGYNVGTNLPITPTLDSLRQNGLTFMNVWSSPVCTPTRAGMLTGKYGVKTGITTAPGQLSTEHTSIFKQLDSYTNNAYANCVAGKWHVSQIGDHDHPIQHGAETYMGVLGAGVDDYYSWDRSENGSASTSTEYVTTHLTDYAINWIGEQTKPWFLWMSHVAPHTPFHVPPNDLYTRSSVASKLDQFLAMIESLDKETERLLNSLSEEEKENTVVIFVGDNGTPNMVLQGFPDGHGKQSLYQGGIHVPMIISGKGVSRKAETEDALINTVDLYATILDIAAPNNEMEGGIYNSHSFNNMLAGGTAPERKYNYAELSSNSKDISLNGYTIRDNRYKYIYYYDEQASEFFDLQEDPMETSNLLVASLTQEQQQILSEMENELDAIRNGWSCSDNIKNGDETSIDCGETCEDCQLTEVSYPIVDTGTTDFYSDDAIIAEPQEGEAFYGQDATYSGNQPSYINNDDGTVTDRVTGLMWQQNMGTKKTFTEASSKADTMVLGGFDNWRVPTIKELYSLIQFTGQAKGETAVKMYIDTDYFDQPLGDTSVGEREIDAQTWSATHYVGTTMNADTTVFGVNFVDGRIKGYPKYSPQNNNPKSMYFRAVRGNPEYGKNIFKGNEDETVSDRATGLMWQQSDDGITRNWDDALSYCESLELAGYNDWRLPNAKELQSLVDYSRAPDITNSPAINPLFGTTEITDPDGNAGQYPYYWTGTTHLDGPNPYDGAVYIAFGEAQGEMDGVLLDVHGAGAQRSDPKDGQASDYPVYHGPQGDVQYVFNYCRCVRDDKTSDYATSTPQVEGKKNSVLIYPNPVSNELNISLEAADLKSLFVKLYSPVGQCILEKETYNTNTISLNLSDLNKGLYILLLQDEDGFSYSRKIVKQ